MNLAALRKSQALQQSGLTGKALLAQRQSQITQAKPPTPAPSVTVTPKPLVSVAPAPPKTGPPKSVTTPAPSGAQVGDTRTDSAGRAQTYTGSYWRTGSQPVTAPPESVSAPTQFAGVPAGSPREKELAKRVLATNLEQVTSPTGSTYYKASQTQPGISPTPAAPSGAQGAATAGGLTDFMDSISQGQTPTGTLSPLQQAIIDALQPSERETGLQGQLATAMAGERQGVQDVEQQAIPMPFITGQRAAIERQAGIQQANITDQLALAQQERATRGGVATALAGFESEAATRAQQERQFGAQQAQQEFSNKVALATKGLRYDSKTGQFSIDPNLSAPDPSEALGVEEGLRKEFVNDAGDFIKIRDAFGRIQAAAVDPSGAGDLALIFNFMKMLDPGSTVREGEFANAQNSTNVPGIVRSLYNRVTEGTRLGESQRSDFVDRSNKLFTAQNTQHQQRIDVFSQLATSAGVNPDNVTINIGLASGLGAGAAISGTPQGTDQFADFKGQLRQGEILIERGGEVGAIPENEFNPSTDKRL